MIIRNGSRVVCICPHLAYREYKGRAKWHQPENIGSRIIVGRRASVVDFMVNGDLKVELDKGGVYVTSAEHWKLCVEQEAR